MNAPSWTLPPLPMAAGLARRLVRAQLAAWGLRHLGETAELLVSELVSNAVRHACGRVGLRLCVREGRVRCEVEDGSPCPPRPRAAGPADEGSRGLALVAVLACGWGSAPTPYGKVVWFELGACAKAGSKLAVAC